MATKNKTQILTDLADNVYPNTEKAITASGLLIPLQDIVNSVSVNITVALLQADTGIATPSLVNIIDAGLQGMFYYDSTDVTTTDDGGAWCIVTEAGQRFKRIIERSINAGWYGQPNYYFPNLAAAQAAIRTLTRFVGLEVTILNNGNITTYWFSGGINNVNLVIKLRETFPIDFTVGDGGALTPADNTSVYTDPSLLGATLVGFYIAGQKIRWTLYPAVLSGALTTDVYAQFNPNANGGANGTITLMNGGTFNQGTYYSIERK